MKRTVNVLFIFFGLLLNAAVAQTKNSAAILMDIKKLEVHGSVLYIAAHPDDENTRLLSYLSNERRFRTGYLSLTRGDGGQNLIGDEQGVDLGLIRTQELLAARRVDGAEQFFTSAYDFGYSKNPDETFRKWDHQKILGEVVYIIRKFRPDVIITRFPTTGEGGHGHHTASAILAGEAFEAAKDPLQFPEQGLAPWTTKRLLWNTFNFGNTNTQKDDQLQIDVGAYNPILGSSYGEMAATSRSNHKSQGFGVPSQRGKAIEYFATIKGPKPTIDLMDEIDCSINRFATANQTLTKKYAETVAMLLRQYDAAQPSLSIPLLQQLHEIVMASDNIQLLQKKSGIEDLILQASGIFMEVVSQSAIISKGDSGRFTVTLNNRTGTKLDAVSVKILEQNISLDISAPNVNSVKTIAMFIPYSYKNTQPYWLEQSLKNGSYTIDPAFTGVPENILDVRFSLTMNGKIYQFEKPLRFKSTDPVKGEVYQSVVITDPLHLSVSPSLVILPDNGIMKKDVTLSLQANKDFDVPAKLEMLNAGKLKILIDSSYSIKKGGSVQQTVAIDKNIFPLQSVNDVSFQVESNGMPLLHNGFRKINYDHIPGINYHFTPSVRVVRMDLKTAGKSAGYIVGAGDKVPEALVQMGYQVVILGEQDLEYEKIKKLDVIITGIRAYNLHSWLSNAHKVLMKYVQEGGVLLVQYNTNNSIGPVKADISPYPFSISRNRITDETANVDFLLPQHPLLNFPNKITSADFDGWIQERSIYHAENIDAHYQKLFSMNDPGEQKNEGSLIVADYGKGRFIYTGIVFFRELPAGVAGAYRLFANLIANKRN